MIPEIRVIYRRTNTAPNPQDLSAFGVVFGYSSLGTRNVVATLGSLAACSAYGFGEGIEHAAEIGLNAGWPTYFCPVTGTPLAAGAVTKSPASAGVPLAVYGSVVAYGSALFAGAANGDIVYKALVSGATIRHVVAGTSTARSIAVAGSAVTVNVATDGGGAVANTETATSILASVVGDTSAQLLVSGVIAGTDTGAGLVAAVAANTLNNGSLELLALAAGVTISLILSGISTALAVPVVVGTNVIVNLATDSAGKPTSTATQVAAAIAAQATAAALVTATPVGSGGGKAGSMAIASLDAGAVTYTPLTRTATTVTHTVSGSNTSLSVPVVTGGHVIVIVGTDAAGLPSSTAAAIASAIAAVPTAAALVTASGSTGKAGPKSSTALQFGSTAALAASGTGNDAFDFIVTCVTAGTVGGSPAPAITWSGDNGALTSGRRLVPANGIVALLDGFVDTGITATLTGVLEVGDVFTFSVARPTVAFADMLTAQAAIIADTSRKAGYVTSPTVITRTQAAQLDTQLQDVATDRYLRGFFNVRDIAEGVSNETEAQWIDTLNAEFNGYVSANGLLRVVAGHFSHISGYSERVYLRPAVFLATGRKSLQAMHQSLAETAMGPLPRIRYLANSTTGVVTDRGIKHDEYKLPGLADERFITTRTFAVKGDGEQYITSSPTMAETSDTGHALIMYVDVLMEAARTAAEAAFPLIEKPAEGIAVAESAQVPKGAISQADADAISSLVGGAVDALLFKPKTDNLPSASRLPPGQRTITVLRNYPYITSRELRMELKVIPLGYNSTITIGVTLELP